MGDGAGGSRAAKKRKKSREAAASSSGRSVALGDSELSGDHAGSEGGMMVKNEGPSNQLKRQKGSSSSTMVSVEQEQLEVVTSGRGILEILALDDPAAVSSTEKGALVLKSLVEDSDGRSLSVFYRDFWGKKPLHSRKAKGYLKGLVTKKALLKLIDNQSLKLGEDIATFFHEEGKSKQDYPLKEESLDTREVHNMFEKEAKHLRFLSPQTHIDMMSRLLAALEVHFNSRVGCHADIVPPYSTDWGKTLVDKADSFVVQMVGSSTWRVYAPRKGEALKCTVSSFDACAATDKENEEALSQPADTFVHASLDDVEYLSNITLQAGDTLYIPKGWGFAYRYAKSPSEGEKGSKGGGKKNTKEKEEDASFFLRLFTNEGSTYRDLLEQTMPAALQVCFEEVPTFRQSLPGDFGNSLGAVHSEADEDVRRQALQANAATMLHRVSQVASTLLDSSADQLTKRFLGQRQPILLTEEEEGRSAAGFADARIMSYTRLRMLRPGIARCVVEDDVCVLYHCMDNSRELYGAPLNPLEFDLDDGVCIEGLLEAYPQGVMVADLPHPSEDDEDKVGVAQALYKEGFLVIDDDAVTQGAGALDEQEGEGEGGKGGGAASDEDDPF